MKNTSAFDPWYSSGVSRGIENNKRRRKQEENRPEVEAKWFLKSKRKFKRTSSKWRKLGSVWPTHVIMNTHTHTHFCVQLKTKFFPVGLKAVQLFLHGGEVLAATGRVQDAAIMCASVSSSAVCPNPMPIRRHSCCQSRGADRNWYRWLWFANVGLRVYFFSAALFVLLFQAMTLGMDSSWCPIS